MTTKIFPLDTETENTSHDIKRGNKRMLSVQLMEGGKAVIYYESSPDMDLNDAKVKLESIIKDGGKFAGYNITNFDVPMIKNFLGVEIPSSQIIEISELPAMDAVRKKVMRDRPSLEQACRCNGVECSHKGIMDARARKLSQLPDVISKAKEGAVKLKEEFISWDSPFCLKLALERISGGMAILEAFNEFVKSGGDTNSDFYKYAIGDVISENKLFLKLKGA